MKEQYKDIDDWLVKTREHPTPPADLESKLLAIATREASRRTGTDDSPLLQSFGFRGTAVHEHRPASLWAGLTIGMIGSLGLLYLSAVSMIHFAANVTDTTWWTVMSTVGVGTVAKDALSALAAVDSGTLLQSMSVVLWCLLGVLASVAFPLATRIHSIR